MNVSSYDVVIVGGGAAGLTAALVLGRARRRVLVIDGGSPRNAAAAHMQGYLSRDGLPPAELLAAGRAEVAHYGVELLDGEVHRIEPGFTVHVRAGEQITARRVLLTTGLRDELPDVTGVRERWGRDLLHCPYCHGWEVRDRSVAVLGGTERAVHQALLLSSLADVALLCNGDAAMSAEQRSSLDAAGVDRLDLAVERIERDGDEIRIAVSGGEPVAVHAVFVQPELSLASDLGAALGAELTEAGGIEADGTGRTSVPGLYAVGDAGAEVQSVAVAVGSGAIAAYAINGELVTEDTTVERTEAQ
jgi:thioredoxin reductase